MKRMIGRILVLFLTAMILAVTVSGATNLDEQSKNREPDMIVRAESLPNDPYWNLQWGPQKIEADWAWNVTVGTGNVLVAVIDSGIDYNHPDLAANYVSGGRDWVNNDEDPMDDYGHGTKVAGVIAAATNNGKGIAGLAQVKVMSEKVLNWQGEGNVYQLADAIRHATDHGAKVISMSLSTSYNGSVLYDPIKYAFAAGVLLVAAAGNQASDAKRYPAAYDEVIAVTSTDQYDQRASDSNFGNWVELAAPGIDIFTTDLFDKNLPPDYQYYRWGSGTSFACPHVSGVAALIMSEFPEATQNWTRSRLKETADDLGDLGFDIYYGWGRINARKAMNWTTPPVVNYTLTITAANGGTTNPAPGNYTSYSEGQSVSVQALPNTDYLLSHWTLDGIDVGVTNPINLLMEANHTLQAIFVLGVHDITIVNISSTKTIVGQGYSLNISVAIENQGNFTEIFNLFVYANTTSAISQEFTLMSGMSTTKTLIWNTTGFANGNYNLSAYVWPVTNETDTEDNTYINGIVLVTLPGDINGDRTVEGKDIALIAKYFGRTSGFPYNADINNDGTIEGKDIAVAAKNFGTSEKNQ